MKHKDFAQISQICAERENASLHARLGPKDSRQVIFDRLKALINSARWQRLGYLIHHRTSVLKGQIKLSFQDVFVRRICITQGVAIGLK